MPGDSKADLRKLLRAYGFDVSAKDGFLLDLSLQDAMSRILGIIHWRKLPDALYPAYLRMAAGLFLAGKLQGGGFSDSGAAADSPSPVASVKEGDTSVTFVDTAAAEEKRVSAFIDKLTNGDDAEILSYRRLPWNSKCRI